MSAGTWSRIGSAGHNLAGLPKAHYLNLRRLGAVAVLALIGLFVLVAMSIGFVRGGARTPLGTARDITTHRLVELDSRIISGGSYTLATVTPTGRAAGFTPGETIDMTAWTLRQKLAFAYPTPPSTPSQLAAHQGFQAVVLAEAFSPRTRDAFYHRAVDILVRLVLLASSLFIIQFAHGRAALFAGLYLGAAAMADSATITFAGLPEPLQVAALVIASLARPMVYLFRTAFAMELYPGSRRVKALIWAGFAVLLVIVFRLYLGQLATLFFGIAPPPISPSVLPLVQCITQIYILTVFAFIAIAAPKAHRFVLRIIFGATSITLASYVIQEVYLLRGVTPPDWMNWYFDTALLGVGIGYPWAIFARRIAGVDFIISRGVAYALALGLILGAIELAKLILQAVAGDWVNGFLLLYAVPVLLTLFFALVARKLENWIGVLLDGDLRNAATILHALEADFPNMRDMAELCAAVSSRAAPALNMADVTIYLAPAIIPEAPAGLIFPIHIFGRDLGALHCGARPHNKGFDTVERALLTELAHEIAVAIICLDPTRAPVTRSVQAAAF